MLLKVMPFWKAFSIRLSFIPNPNPQPHTPFLSCEPFLCVKVCEDVYKILMQTHLLWSFEKNPTSPQSENLYPAIYHWNESPEYNETVSNVDLKATLPLIHISRPDSQHVQVQILWPLANQERSLDNETRLMQIWNLACMDIQLPTLVNKIVKVFQGWWGQYLLLIFGPLSFQPKPIILHKHYYSL
jgi:hypothetical protein